MASMLALVAALSFLVSFSSAFRPLAKNNVAIYWGQGPNQERLIETCKNPNVDIINIGFVNVFPDQGPGGYPGTNFGNACQGDVYKHNGKNTDLLKTCSFIGPDVTACQQQYGKKILLSLGGGYPTDYYIANNKSAVNFANFLWGAFGPQTKAWVSANKPRPFGTAVVDGFDFDIESQVSPAPEHNGVAVNDYQTRGYAKMIQTFKQVLFNKDTSKKYFISGAPQCIVPDAHFAGLVSSVWFDFLFVQFYNTPYCSARAGVNNINGDKSADISFPRWTQIKFFNPKTRVYIGLPANTNASNSADNYLNPTDANKLIRRFYKNAKFGGVMLWEATYAMNNVICGKDYATWIKQILKAAVNNKAISTTCVSPNTSFASINATSVSPDSKYAAVKNFKEVPISKRFVPAHTINGKRQLTFSNTSSVVASTTSSATSSLISSLTDISASSSAAINATAPANGALQATTTASVSSSVGLDSQITSSAGSLPSSSSESPAMANTTSAESAAAAAAAAATASSSRNSSSATFASATSAGSSNSTGSANLTNAQATALTSSSGFSNSTLPTISASTITPSPNMNMTSSISSSSIHATSSANATSAISQNAAARTTSSASETTETITIFSTRYLTITQELNTQTITTIFPVATRTIVVTGSQIPSSSAASAADAEATDSMESATPTPSLTAMIDITITKTITVYATEAITTCAPGVSGCSSLPASQTVLSTVTKVVSVYTTLIVTQAPVAAVASATASNTAESSAAKSSAQESDAANTQEASATGDAASTLTEVKTRTNYNTQYYTTVDVLLASSSSLYNPHSDEDTTRTTVATLKSTSTVYNTITVEVTRPTVRSTMTVTATVTVSPVSTFPLHPNPTKDTQVYSPKEQAEQAAAAQSAQSASSAAAQASSKSVAYSAAGAQETAAAASGNQNSIGNAQPDSGSSSGAKSGGSPPAGIYSNSTASSGSQISGAAQASGYAHTVSSAGTSTASSLADAVAATPYPMPNNATAEYQYKAFATVPAFKMAAHINAGSSLKFDASLASVAVAVLVLVVDGLFL